MFESTKVASIAHEIFLCLVVTCDTSDAAILREKADESITAAEVWLQAEAELLASVPIFEVIGDPRRVSPDERCVVRIGEVPTNTGEDWSTWTWIDCPEGPEARIPDEEGELVRLETMSVAEWREKHPTLPAFVRSVDEGETPGTFSWWLSTLDAENAAALAIETGSR